MTRDPAFTCLFQLGRENSRGVKLILMSATLDLHKFERYFQYDLPNGMKGGPGQVEIMERYNFDVQDYFMDTLNLSALPTQEQIPEFDFVSKTWFKSQFLTLQYISEAKLMQWLLLGLETSFG